MEKDINNNFHTVARYYSKADRYRHNWRKKIALVIYDILHKANLRTMIDFADKNIGLLSEYAYDFHLKFLQYITHFPTHSINLTHLVQNS